MTTSHRSVLTFNAGFSLISGLVFLLAPSMIGGWLGIDADLVLRLAGAVFFGHAVLIAVLLERLPERQVALLNLVAVGPYPLLVIALVLTGVIDRPLGQVLALLDAAIIAVVVGAHAIGLRKVGRARQAVPA